jgi:hypothetical protein
MSHTHEELGPSGFDGTQDHFPYSCVHVLEQAHPILRVTHDEGDGAWQFLCGGLHEVSDGRLVCLGCILESDATLRGLGDLPVGWCADRESVDSPWERSPNEPEAIE